MVYNSYISDLEKRIARLAAHSHRKNHAGGSVDDGGGGDTSSQEPHASEVLQSTPPSQDAHISQSWNLDNAINLDTHPSPSSTLETAARADAAQALDMARPPTVQELSFSSIFLTSLIKSRITPQLQKPSTIVDEIQGDSTLADPVADLDTGPISLPNKNAAQNLVKAYFAFTELSMPLLHRPSFEYKLELLYTMPKIIDLNGTHTTYEARIALFFVFEVFSIALLSMQKQEPSKVPTWLADRYHENAVKALCEAGLRNDIEGVQALLLVGQHAYHHPTVWAAWKTIGVALRLAVELQLHQDHEAEELDLLKLDTMRRTFWVAYAMDRNMSIAMTMPSCLSDGVITAKFPSLVEDDFITPQRITEDTEHISGSKRISQHLFRYRQIQSEMQTALCESPPPPYQSVDLVKWQEQMHARIDQWYTSSPTTDSLNSSEKTVIETFEVTYNTALLYLSRPSPNIPDPAEPQLLIMTRAATHMINLYRRFFLERKLSIYWQAVENLSSAGTFLLYGYVHSPQVREQLPLRSIESLVRTCSSTLWGMVEHFPAFRGKRDAFDMIAAKVLADLRTDPTDSSAIGQPSFQNTINHAADNNLWTSIGSDRSIDDVRLSPAVNNVSSIDCGPTVNSLYNHQPVVRLSTAGDEFHPDQGPGFSFADLDGMSLDWDEMTNMNNGYISSWL